MAAGAASPATHFMGHDEARRVLTEGAERGFYAHLQIVEMRAKTGLDLGGEDVEGARAQVEAAFGAATVDFTLEEQAALRDAVDHLQPLLEARAPLYARTPWSFIKVRDTIEGGLPHTRGDSIVLPESVLSSLVHSHASRSPDRAPFAWTVLVHAQTHVIQRRHPKLFAKLYTSILGFEHAALPAPPEWVVSARMTNPDAPVADWAFSLGRGTARRWYLAEILVDHGDHPRMPADFRIVALRLTHHGTEWAYADQVQPAEIIELSSLTEFVERFPVRDELYHPGEIAADLLSSLIVGGPLVRADSRMWADTRRWATRALK